MRVIITLAGHSRRFKSAGYNLPKFLIKIDGKPIVSHVVDLFDYRDNFHFVLNNKQVEDYPDLKDFLESLAKKVEVTIIKEHELGPTFSALHVDNIKEKEEVIISYCDFKIHWNYQAFKREVFGCEAAAPSFKGFHPASFGNTLFAYMKVNKKNEMLRLKEKESFTKKRQEEYANVGIYYFNSWSLFKKYANKLYEEEDFSGLREGYTSLLLNPMVKDGLTVKVTDVDKFICLGTPEDLDQYKFWSEFFTEDSPKVPKALPKQINLIPMAGKGSRFRLSGYQTSKPLVLVKEKPMIIQACKSFPSASKWVFLPRQEDLDKYPIKDSLKEIDDKASVIGVKKETSGQLATCLLAKDKIKSKDPIFIASCDYVTHYSFDDWKIITEDKSIDGAIWTFKTKFIAIKEPRAFAYCQTIGDTNLVSEVVEKNTISANPGEDPVVVGSFWFRKGEDFLWCAENSIKRDMRVKNEYFIGNSINLLLKEKKRKFVTFPITKWISFGDPFELKIYEYWEDYYRKSREIEFNL